MRSRTVRWVALAAAGALVGLTGGTIAHAEDAVVPDTTAPVEPVAEPVVEPVVEPVAALPAVTTLPLFGTPLTIDVTTGPGGALSSVIINPADGYTATTVKPNKVAFVNEDGTAKVVVKSRHGGQRIEAKAGTLADLSGTGGWAGEMFPGVPVTVAFTVGDRGDGSPDITGISVVGGTFEIGAVDYTSHDHDDDDELVAKVGIKFTNDEQARWLSIKAEVETDDDGTSHANVRVSLSRIRNPRLEGDAALGAHQWAGVLCTNTPATIDYIVEADGTITLGAIVPTPADTRVEGNGVAVRFEGGEKVRIRTHDADGVISLKVDDRIRCRNAADPSVGDVPIVTSPDDDHDGDHHGRGGRGGDAGDDRKGGRGGHDDKGDDGKGDDETPDTSPDTTTESTLADG